MAAPTPPAVLIAQLRRMVAEPTAAAYTDDLLSAALARWPLRDGLGLRPDDAGWTGRWDVNQAAADIWEEKAAALAADFDFSADGGQYSRSQAHAQMLGMARRFRARREAGSVPLIANPPMEGAGSLRTWIGNLPESDD